MHNEHIALPFAEGPGGRPITMRGPADMAELLPYLLGFFPDDSIVAVGLQPPGLHQGGVIRLDIPESAEEWPAAAEETAALLVRLSERQDERPVQVLLYLCQDPGREHGPPVAERLRPLADRLHRAFASRGVRVKESLCVSAGRWWSFLCTREGCCDPAGHPIRHSPGPGPVAVAATVAGLVPRGSRKEILAGLAPVGPPAADALRAALLRAGSGAAGRRLSLTRRESAELLDRVVAEFLAGATALDEDRTARLLLALQDRLIRDRAAEYARPDELAAVQRLWRFLATRCVAPHERLAAPPLTLLAWICWVAGDTATARVVLGHTLRRHPSYLLAQLLYESLNGGFAPETLLASVEAERCRRTERERAAAEGAAGPPEAVPGGGAGAADTAVADSGAADSGPGSGGPDRPDGPVEPERPRGGAGPDGAAPAKSRRRRGRRRGRPGPVDGSAPSTGTCPGRAADTPVGPEHPAGAPPGPPEQRGARRGPAEPGPAPVAGHHLGHHPGREPAAGRRSAGCGPVDRPHPGRRVRLGRPSPWAAPSPAAARRGRCREVRRAAAGERHAR
ncbi:DUF4192 domain-containing protein [Kitasatospora sp. NPDC093806]|uniref:DUF4192 domain-containing protein n=1 Tax=Kitasatospora sp. NPDC093806 TaxID=3155075 RepID=UPI0034263FDC